MAPSIRIPPFPFKIPPKSWKGASRRKTFRGSVKVIGGCYCCYKRSGRKAIKARATGNSNRYEALHLDSRGKIP